MRKISLISFLLLSTKLFFYLSCLSSTLLSKTGLWRLGRFQAALSAGLSRAETDQFIPLQLSLQPFRLIVNLWYKLALKERATTNEIKCELEKKEGATELLP